VALDVFDADPCVAVALQFYAPESLRCHRCCLPHRGLPSGGLHPIGAITAWSGSGQGPGRAATSKMLWPCGSPDRAQVRECDSGPGQRILEPLDGSRAGLIHPRLVKAPNAAHRPGARASLRSEAVICSVDQSSQSGQCGGIRSRRSGSARRPTWTPESGAVPPVCETAVRDSRLALVPAGSPLLEARPVPDRLIRITPRSCPRGRRRRRGHRVLSARLRAGPRPRRGWMDRPARATHRGRADLRQFDGHTSIGSAPGPGARPGAVAAGTPASWRRSPPT
jgi:hypothetical protein